MVYSTAHRKHDPVTEIETGTAVAPYERPARAEAIHDALAADPALFDVQATLHGALTPLLHGETHSTPGAWIPHVTLAEGLSDTAVAAAMNTLLPTFTSVSAELNRIELVRFPPVRVEWGIAVPAQPRTLPSATPTCPPLVS